MSVTVTVRSRVPVYTAAALVKVGLAVTKATFDTEALAKARAPVDTGYLRSAITGRMVGKTEGEVVSNADYSIYQEFGTYKMSAQPFMVPALEQVLPAFESAVKGALR